MTTRRLTTMLLALLALAAAGCGGDDATDASADTETAVTEATTGQTADPGNDGAGALGESCVELAGIGSRVAETFSSGTGDLDRVREVFDELADQVPDEIADDYQVVADNFGEIADELEGVDLGSATPSPEDLQKLQELAASLDSPEVREAAANIQAWVEANC